MIQTLEATAAVLNRFMTKPGHQESANTPPEPPSGARHLNILLLRCLASAGVANRRQVQPRVPRCSRDAVKGAGRFGPGHGRNIVSDLLAAIRKLRISLETPIPYPDRPGETCINLSDSGQSPSVRCFSVRPVTRPTELLLVVAVEQEDAWRSQNHLPLSRAACHNYLTRIEQIACRNTAGCQAKAFA